MKLKDLLKQFEGMDLEAEVFAEMSVGCCGDNEMLDAPQIWEEDVLNKGVKSGAKRVRISYPALDFLDSCRKYAGALSRNITTPGNSSEPSDQKI